VVLKINCYLINKQQKLTKKTTTLIIWDEAPMTHKIAFEALNRTLRDIVPTPSSADKGLPFGGKVVVLGVILGKLYLSYKEVHI
jgi:hypothetical protein